MRNRKVLAHLLVLAVVFETPCAHCEVLIVENSINDLTYRKDTKSFSPSEQFKSTDKQHVTDLLMLLLILLHPLHNPLTILLRISLRGLLTLHPLPQLKLLRHIDAPLHRLPALNSVQPPPEFLKRLRLDARPGCPVDPREARDVRDAEFAADDPEVLACGFLGREAVVEDAVEALGFVLVAVYCVLDFGRGVAVEVVSLLFVSCGCLESILSMSDLGLA